MPDIIPVERQMKSGWSMPSRASFQVLSKPEQHRVEMPLHQCWGSWAAGVRNSSPGAEQNIQSLELTCHHCFHCNSVNHKRVKGTFIIPLNPGNATDLTGLSSPNAWAKQFWGWGAGCPNPHHESPKSSIAGSKECKESTPWLSLSFSFHFDQHLHPAVGADPESQGYFLRLNGEIATRFSFTIPVSRVWHLWCLCRGLRIDLNFALHWNSPQLS